MTQVATQISTVESYLRSLSNRQVEGREDKNVARLLNELKDSAVCNDDQAVAKRCWCLETVQHYQNRYVTCFENMKSGYYLDAWFALAAIEKGLYFLERHFPLDAYSCDAFSLLHIRKSTKNFQMLYPYILFASPELEIRQRSCSICGRVVSIHSPCPHRVGEIYNGEFCSRHVDVVKVLDIAYVPNPYDKRTVQFVIDRETGRPVDTYNYALVHCAIGIIGDPFRNWDLVVCGQPRLVSDLRYVGRNEPCPCGSGDKFRKCCILKKQLLQQYFAIRLHDRDSTHLDAIVASEHVEGIPRYPFDRSNSSTQLYSSN